MAKKLNDEEFRKALKEAQKDPNFKREIDEFIKASLTVRKL